MNDITGKPAEVHFKLHVTRAATGLTETYDMVGHVLPEADSPPPEPPPTLEGDKECL